jgi:hypothetical protein
MGRYCIRVNLKDRPEVKLTRTYTKDSDRLAVKQMLHLVDTVTAAHKIDFNAVAWTIERLVGAPGQWEIIYHDRMQDAWMVTGRANR